ncbi:MAG: hypothetical protein WBL93_07770 [Lutisporaceae bacterium]
MVLDLKKEFYEWIVNWEEKLNEDEWYFTQFRENVINDIIPEQAYTQIPEAVELVLEQTDPWLLGECFEILLSLCTKSDTTRIPSCLSLNWEQLDNSLSYHGQYYKDRLSELKRWYRIY